jgi:thioester reductase-like protein
VSTLKKCAVITGATGLLGSWLAFSLFKSGLYHKLIFLVRAADNGAASTRLSSAISRIPPFSKNKKTRNFLAVAGDLKTINLERGLARELRQYDKVDIFNSAAIADFNLSLAKLRPINVEGTKNLLDFLAYISQSNRNTSVKLHHISTVAIAGDHQ